MHVAFDSIRNFKLQIFNLKFKIVEVNDQH